MPTPETSNEPGENRASRDGESSALRLRVLLPLPLAGAYDYRADPELGLKPGDFVDVPLGRRRAVGVVWDPEKEIGEAVAEAKLRDVIGRRAVPPLPAEMRRFIDWVSAYTLAPPG